jgi:hypothetical protein
MPGITPELREARSKYPLTKDEFDATPKRVIPGFPGYYASEDGHILSGIEGYRRLSACEHKKTHYLYVLLVTPDRNRASRGVHALVCMAFHGAKPSARHLAMHANDIRLDNRPSNLSWGTHKDNNGSAAAKGRSARGERRPNAVLTDEIVRQIRTLAAQRVSHRSIAKQFGVARTTIDLVVARKTWAHV